jgi:hypothetical protein
VLLYHMQHSQNSLGPTKLVVPAWGEAPPPKPATWFKLLLLLCGPTASPALTQSGRLVPTPSTAPKLCQLRFSEPQHSSKHRAFWGVLAWKRIPRNSLSLDSTDLGCKKAPKAWISVANCPWSHELCFQTQFFPRPHPAMRC